MSPGHMAAAAVSIALAAVLSLVSVKLPHLLYGGSVSLHTLPIFFVALRHGVRSGVLAGVGYGVVNLLMTPYFVHPVQLVLDYPLAFGVLGAAGLVGAAGRRPGVAVLAVALSSAGRLACHFLSGIVYFGQLAPDGTAVWIYSLLYNASYMVPETLIACAATAMLVRRVAPRPIPVATNDGESP